MNKTTFQQMSELFPRVMHMIMKDFTSPTGERIGLNRTQIHTLIKIQKFEPANMGLLCHYIGLTKGSMTTIIDLLVDNGYALRERSQKDRRKVFVVLTEEGESVASSCRQELEQSFDRDLGRLTPAEKDDFDRAMTTMTEVLGKIERMKNE